MRKVIYYAFLMIVIIVGLPFLIVRGCSISEEQTAPEKNVVGEDIKVKVYMTAEDKVVELPLEEYIKGVVAAEMPAEFAMEALKAQAVAARTYVYGRMKGLYGVDDGRHKGADICTDVHCQVWISKEAAMKKWGIFSASRYWKKIEKAVNETRHVILTYDDKIINPVFHSNSGGKTENSEDVWEGRAEPYLRSVVSNGEEAYKGFKTEVLINDDDFRSIIKKKYRDIKLGKDVFADIKILDHTEGGRVKNIRIGDMTLTGTEVRELFTLKSANFKIEREGKDTLKVTTIGNGHGVGMSQWGANYLAKNGSTYEEILKYYYKGVELEILSD